MNKIRAKEIVRLVINQGATTITPTPFAGEYPTRIYWVVSILGQGTIYYTGKPSRITVQKMLKLAAHPQMQSVSFMEVDMQNTLCSLYTERRNFADRRATFYAGWNVYHPFTVGSKGWEWLLQPWWRREMMKIPVYSPVEILTPQMHIKPYEVAFKNYIWTPRRSIRQMRLRAGDV